MQKRILSIALALVMTLALLPGSALAADLTAVEVIPPKYFEVKDFREGLAAVNTGDAATAKWGFIDKTGKEVIPCEYDQANHFSEGLAAVCKDGKWGFLDQAGKLAVACKYDEVKDFSEGLAVVCLDERWGFIDRAGKEVIALQYKRVTSFSEGLAGVQGDNSRWGFIDAAGNMIIPCQYYENFMASLGGGGGYPHFSNGISIVQTDFVEGYGVIDKKGNVVVPFGKYMPIEDAGEGMITARGEGGKETLLDRNGKIVVSGNQYWIGPFSEGLATATPGNRVSEGTGVIDTKGNVVIPCTLKYDEVGIFREGLARVADQVEVKVNDSLTSIQRKEGFIDTTGKEVVPPKYDGANHFSEGYAAVMMGNVAYRHFGNCSCGFIDKTGKEVVPLIYQDVHDFFEGMAAVQKDGKWGFIAMLDTPVAQENQQTIRVDGRDVTFTTYSIQGGGVNYVRLMELAGVLSGTKAEYNVVWNGKTNQVELMSKTSYTAGAVQETPFHGEMPYEAVDTPTCVDGVEKDMEAIRFEYNGGGYTYYKLRDLGEALGFNVGWDRVNENIYLETDRPYDPSN